MICESAVEAPWLQGTWRRRIQMWSRIICLASSFHVFIRKYPGALQHFPPHESSPSQPNPSEYHRKGPICHQLTFLWQILASVCLKNYTIHRLAAAAPVAVGMLHAGGKAGWTGPSSACLPDDRQPALHPSRQVAYIRAAVGHRVNSGIPFFKANPFLPPVST